jgi:phosphoglycerate dehydrogenase-like enzyme
MRIAVTEPEYQKARAVFARALEENYECLPVPTEEEPLALELRQQGFQHVIVGVTPYRGPLYAALQPGSVLARFGVGHDGINKELATRHRLFCTNTPGVLDDSVAEHAMGLLMALARHTPAQTARLLAGEWSPRMGMELAEKRLAVLGTGGIGRRVAQIASRGFGMKVVGLRRSQAQTRELQEQFGFERVVTDFREAVAGAEFVSLHLPSSPETRHFLNRSRLAELPAGCLLINTARGVLVDEVALFDALQAERIAGAALDVFETEPYQPQAPGKDLRQLPNVVITPHIGSSTGEASARMAQRALRNIQLAAVGKYAEMDLLNPAVLSLKV